MAASFDMTAWRNRTSDYTIALYQVDGTTGVTLDAADKVRIKIGRGNAATPDLDIDNIAALSGGSLVTVNSLIAPASLTLRLAQGDLSALPPGTYDMEINVVDDSDVVTGSTRAIKHAQNGCLHLIGALGGDIGVV